MDFSSFQEILNKITTQFGESVIKEINAEAIQPFIEIEPNSLHNVCTFLYENDSLYFDFLNCITAVDNGPEKGTLEVWYHLSSIPFEKSFIVKVVLDRGSEENLPEIQSVSSVWKTAEWHEREAFDLVGITFSSHPDLRRILLPADWHGHPLRKDYQEQETYHGIKVKY
ncbi:MAG: NADH-quinone oxidoreductase subunit C [Cytophagales bacterium]|nr:NADH-quinone oxidoreductase subunit C [Cytophagales bacterium]